MGETTTNATGYVFLNDVWQTMMHLARSFPIEVSNSLDFFWSTLPKLLSFEHRLSSAYRLEKEIFAGLFNAILKEVLRTFVNDSQSNRVSLSPIALHPINSWLC